MFYPSVWFFLFYINMQNLCDKKETSGLLLRVGNVWMPTLSAPADYFPTQNLAKTSSTRETVTASSVMPLWSAERASSTPRSAR